jgi:hypothetical protein
MCTYVCIYVCIEPRRPLPQHIVTEPGGVLPLDIVWRITLCAPLRAVVISMHIMANIMIMGDSWACGEWGGRDTPEGYGVTHAGTQQYLTESGHRVCQLAEGGSSNRRQVDRRLELTDPVDHSIWFLTDPLRDIPETDIALTLVEYRAQRDHLLRQQFDRVRHLPILLVGGVSAVPAWVHSEYPLFTTLVPDLRRWLLPHAEPCETLCRRWRYPTCDPALLQHWERQERTLARHLAHALIPDRIEHRWFWPDGRHPNRAAHQRLTHELILPLL